ncbi:hypothetical protein L5515_016194 [Caenorhabditis briggsae]|uniref:F-box domain-containing protein n=1 Tax=Caenorhabditis briggsae TaxID=6238 RepID=A0AAE9FAK0_CAEBR|nr:hypothetical protein L5515_016194 [Caenorhabditis briggsae]
MLLKLTDVVLDKLGKTLPAKDLLSLSLVQSSLNEFFDKEVYWQRLMTKHLWIDRKMFRSKDDILFLLNNTPSCPQETFDYGEKILRFATFSNDGSMLAVIGNECRLWVYREEEEILFVQLHEKRRWNKVLSVAFSPDDNHILIVGFMEEILAMRRKNEACVYELGEDHARLHSFNYLDQGMLSTWLDNKHILYMSNNGMRDRMRIFISSIDISSEIMIFPILTFNTRVTKILVAQHVSPRTRKITQIADQAQEEGKTLSQKLFEIGLESGVDVNNMQELRAILDQESQCMPCYRLHSHHDAVSQRNCSCQCHHNTDKLLIFHGNDDRLHIKVITHRLLERAKQAWRQRGDVEEDADQNRLFSPLLHCTSFDTVDHVFRTGFSLLKSSMCFSPDHRYLYVTGTREAEKPKDPIMEIKPTCLDLETMVIKSTPDFSIHPWVEYDYSACITANNDFVALFTGKDVLLWSSFHRGYPTKILSDFNWPISSVALHPLKNELVATCQTELRYFQSPVLKIENNSTQT